MLILNLDYQVTLGDALRHADDLVTEPNHADANVEYMRGQVELIASLFGAGDLDQAKHAVVTMLGWPDKGISS